MNKLSYRAPALDKGLDIVELLAVSTVGLTQAQIASHLKKSVNEIYRMLNTLKERGIYFKSIQESIDTSTSGGKLIFHVFGALAEFERDIIRERTMAGLKAARARGRKGGRPRLMDDKKIAMAKSLMADKTNTVNQVCKTLGVSRSTLYRYLQE